MVYFWVDRQHMNIYSWFLKVLILGQLMADVSGLVHMLNILLCWENWRRHIRETTQNVCSEAVMYTCSCAFRSHLGMSNEVWIFEAVVFVSTQNSTWIDHVTLTTPIGERGTVSSESKYLVWPTCMYKIWRLASANLKICRKTLNVKMEMIWWLWSINSKSLAMSLSDRMHMTSHSRFIETICLCINSKFFVESCQKFPTRVTQLYLMPPLRMTH